MFSVIRFILFVEIKPYSNPDRGLNVISDTPPFSIKKVMGSILFVL